MKPFSRTPEYKAMAEAKYRCSNPNCRAYSYYGGRGILFEFSSIADATRWVLDNLGQRPTPKHSIDRYPNKDGPYAPGNLRWATKSEQALNRNDHNRAKSHCKHGHRFDSGNTLVRADGERSCRTCTRLRMRKRRGSQPRYKNDGGFRDQL